MPMRNLSNKTPLSLIVIGLLFCQMNIQAQTGYLGKRFELQLDARLTPAWWTANVQDELGPFKYDVSWCPGIQFILGEASSVGVNYQISNARYAVSYTSDPWEKATPNKWEDLSVRGISAYFRHTYFTQSPIGPYAQIGLNYFTYSAPYRLPYSSEDIEIFSRMYGLHIEFGDTYTLADYLSISPYMSSGFSIGNGKITDDYTELRYPLAPNTYAEKKIRQMGYLQFGVRIGIIAI